MKTGDTVELQYKFDVDSYEENTKTFQISIKTHNDKVHWTIPVYIGVLGIYPPGNRFIVPGDYLAKTHPDYYKVLDINKLIVEVKGSAYRIILEESFFYDGKYRLEPLDRELFTVNRIASQYTTEKLNEICYGLVGSEVNAEIIRGIVVRLYIKANNELRYFESFPNMITKSTSNKYVVIHDEDTNIEYSMPYDYLKVKS